MHLLHIAVSYSLGTEAVSGFKNWVFEHILTLNNSPQGKGGIEWWAKLIWRKPTGRAWREAWTIVTGGAWNSKWDDLTPGMTKHSPGNGTGYAPSGINNNILSGAKNNITRPIPLLPPASASAAVWSSSSWRLHSLRIRTGTDIVRTARAKQQR